MVVLVVAFWVVAKVVAKPLLRLLIRKPPPGTPKTTRKNTTKNIVDRDPCSLNAFLLRLGFLCGLFRDDLRCANLFLNDQFPSRRFFWHGLRFDTLTVK